MLTGLLSVLHDGLFTVRDDRLSVLRHILEDAVWSCFRLNELALRRRRTHRAILHRLPVGELGSAQRPVEVVRRSIGGTMVARGR